MISRFGKKFWEYLSWEFENKFALIATIIMSILGIKVKVYTNFEQYVILINDICNSLMGAYIGMLALIFSGVIFLASLLNNSFEKVLMKYSNDENVSDKLFLSYLFLAFNILCMILITIVIMFVSNSALPKVTSTVFAVVYVMYMYFSFFILGYVVALIRNTIDLISIARNEQDKKSFYERANEIRIDMILQYVYANASREETKKHLKKFFTDYVGALNESDEEKKKLMEYFSEYYGFNDKEKES